MHLYAIECRNCKWYADDRTTEPYCKILVRRPVVKPDDVCEYFEEVNGMITTEYRVGWVDGYAKAMENGKRISGVLDKTGKIIHAGDKVKGLFWLGEEITGVCTFREGAYGIRWMRGGAEEFTAFCQCCNVEWEVQK